MIHLDRIGKQFGARIVFEDLSWRIPRSGRWGLVGPNGAGKTTLLRILAGRDAPDRGDVRGLRDLRIAFLPQEVEALSGGTVLTTALDGLEHVRRLEAGLAGIEGELACLGPGDPRAKHLTGTYGELRARFEAAGGDRAEARARAVLTGLGFAASALEDPLARLSGGWRMRAVLARLLLSDPDLLLLDEPTNHLDLEAMTWLEGFLAGFVGAFIVVSHDRYFLNRLVGGIAELRDGRLTVYRGTYEEYAVERARRGEALEKAAREQARDLERAGRFIERFRAKATKARQVQSRLKALEKVERIEVRRRTRAVRFGFPAPPRSGDVVVRAERLGKSFGERVVYRGVDFILRRGDRVALVGPNGSGKSTLLKLLAGSLAPDAGTLELGHNVQPASFAQHHLEALDPAATALEEMERVAEPEVRPRLRSLLGRFLFRGEEVGKKVAVLSGGEKARLALARMLVRPVNLLLLDEPTNHLDLESREVLEEALDEYEGTLVVVSHDRYFMERVATVIAEVGGGRLDLFPGSYSDYVERRRRDEPGLGAAEVGGSEAATPRALARDLRRLEVEERNRRYRERRALEERLGVVEEGIESLEARLREIAALQTDPSLYRDAGRAKEIGREKVETEARLRQLYARWETLASSRAE